MDNIEFFRNEDFSPASDNSKKSEVSRSQAQRKDTSAGLARPVEFLQNSIDEFDLDHEMLPPVPDHQATLNLLMKNADILIAAGDYRLATNLLRNVLMRSPQNPEALKRLGITLKSEGRLDEALKCFRGFLKNAPDITTQIVASNMIAETLYLAERDEMALGVYRDILRHVIDNKQMLFDIYKNVGNIHVRAGDFDAAEEFYNKAYTLDPKSDVLLVNYGTLEIQRENLEAAVERFRKAVELNAANDRGWVGLAMIHRMMSDFDLAHANLERALDVNPNNRTALRLSVDWGAQDHRFDNPIRRLQAYIADQGSEDAEFCFALAKLFTQVGCLREARIEMERVLALDVGMEGADGLAKALDAELARRGVSETKGA
jgi:tetratricopeptide (TPR) repeat protein